MNSPDSFEERLRRTPLRQAPAGLRVQVLAAPRRAPAAPGSAVDSMREWILQKLWPHPAAWGALGFAWLLVVCLNLAALEQSGPAPARRANAPASPAWTAALREQRALLRSLLQEPPSLAVLPEERPGAQLRKAGSLRPLVLA